MADPSPDVRDFFFRIDVDPGETYPQSNGSSPSSVYFAQYVTFQGASGGYLGLQRSGGTKRAIVSLWQDNVPANAPYFNAVSGAIPAINCYEFGKCSSIQGTYDWKVGHEYRFRFERSPTKPTGWWQIILTDLTTSRADILGELQTPPSWGGLTQSNGLFLEYFWGPYQCDTLRHSLTTYMPPQGNYGKTTAIKSASGESYHNDNPMPCTPALVTSNMTQADIDSRSYLDGKNNVIGVGNGYRGIQPWPNSSNKTVKGLMYAANPKGDTPELYRALKTGAAGSFPAIGQTNADWQYIGRGYPVINDLYHSGRRLYTWEERHAAGVVIGDIFVYDNPYNGDVEYFRKASNSPWYFPIDKTSNGDWTYLGRHSKKDEPRKSESLRAWGTNNRFGKPGDLFNAGNMVFRLKTANQYWYFPTTPVDNEWWQFVDYMR
ncbi:hypothetical protein QTH91_10640 [Variovorax dokdonensis]|uniref:DUF3472 domain-containing protein n=1 Tax=Variovorax dokdonensis TaxID=344883 RepID=A0ABT7NAJ2_9BURK|nr:hypothetical protein [Variovorax dokdonensis]MDM0044943.1 hypothetical protein [Variovorax dokdonensis]